jgi:hypothetical protein
MARKRQRKKSRLWRALLLLSLPLVVWFLAFFIWFYWYDLRKLMGRYDAPPPRAKPARSIDKDQRRDGTPPSKPQEKIFNEDRKKLEDILKQRS